VTARPRCRACGRTLSTLWASATDTEYGTTTERFGYYLCEGCDCLSIDPVPEGRLGEIYPSSYYSFAGGDEAQTSRRHPVTRVKAWLDERTFRGVLDGVGSRALRILDVGGGTGDIAAGLMRAAPDGSSATVVDFDPASIEVARARGLDAFCGRFEDFESEERFDLVLMLNLLEHVADPLDILTRARAQLTSDGVLWLQTPNFRALDARLFRHRNWAGYHCPRHWAIFSEAGLTRALERCGLRADSVERTQAGSFWAGSALGLRRAREPRRAVGARPLVQSPAFLPLAGAGAAFDIATRRLRPTSQVVALARAA
jgi:SAM-dependent methyltransferase